jgi:hypothetical protein
MCLSAFLITTLFATSHLCSPHIMAKSLLNMRAVHSSPTRGVRPDPTLRRDEDGDRLVSRGHHRMRRGGSTGNSGRITIEYTGDDTAESDSSSTVQTRNWRKRKADAGQAEQTAPGWRYRQPAWDLVSNFTNDVRYKVSGLQTTCTLRGLM